MKYSIILLLGCLFYSFQYPSFEKESDDVTEVYIFLEGECRISQFYTKTLNELHERFANKNIIFTGVFPGQTTKQADIAAFKVKYDIPFALVFDKQQALTKKFEAKITPEVVVYRPKENKIIYKGRIDDAYFRVGKRRNVVTSNELKDVLRCINTNQPVNTSWKEAIGCYIKLN